MLLPRDTLRKVGEHRGFWYPEDIGYGEDFDLSLALIDATPAGSLIFLDDVLTLKSLHGDSISNTTRALSIAADHVRIFWRHKRLRRALLARALVDLAVQRFLPRATKLRQRVGYPGLRYGFQTPTDFDTVERRLRELSALAPAAPN
jgi:hypothetical protein